MRRVRVWLLLALLAVVCACVAANEDEAEGPKRVYGVILSTSGCTMSGYPGATNFLISESGYYPDLEVKYVGGPPRLLVFDSKEDRDNAVVEPWTMTPDEVIAMLDNPPETPEPLEEVSLVKFTTMAQVHGKMEELGFQRTLTYDEDKRPGDPYEERNLPP